MGPGHPGARSCQFGCPKYGPGPLRGSARVNLVAESVTLARSEACSCQFDSREHNLGAQIGTAPCFRPPNCQRTPDFQDTGPLSAPELPRGGRARAVRAVRAGQSRSRIEGDQVREWFSPNYSFAYQRRRSTRTSLVGRVIRSTGLLGRNGPGRGLRERFSTLESFVYRERGDTRTTFVQFFVRVLGEARYANDLSTRGPGRAGDEARAGGHHRSSCSSPSFEKPGFCTIPQALAARFFAVASPFACIADRWPEETPGQRLAGISEQGRGGRILCCPKEYYRAEPPFDPSNGRKICPGRTAGPQFAGEP